jgi:hypothetical protein
MSGVARTSVGDIWTAGAQQSGRGGNTDLRLFFNMGPANTAAPRGPDQKISSVTALSSCKHGSRANILN